MRFISSKDRPNPSLGELKQAQKHSRKILDSRRGGATPLLEAVEVVSRGPGGGSTASSTTASSTTASSITASCPYKVPGWFISHFRKSVKRLVSSHSRSYSAQTMSGSFLLKYCVENWGDCCRKPAYKPPSLYKVLIKDLITYKVLNKDFVRSLLRTL